MAKAEFPESYKDERYAKIDAATEQKVGLPTGLLAAVRTRGERSNHSQTNDRGTATVYQFIPATRKAILDKYGIDVTLSPQNASEGAGLLLKEGLDRNQGNAPLAVAEYVGGLDRSRWGATTRAYVQRVVGAQPAAVTDAAPVVPTTLPPADSRSTFQRAMADQQAPASPQLASVLQAYQAGQMTPEEAAEFEADVRSGAVLLPRGATLSPSRAAAPAGTAGATVPELPAGVIDAFAQGKLTPEERRDLEADIKAGVVRLPTGAQLGNSAAVAAIPGAAEDRPVAGPSPAEPAPSLVDRTIGAGEAALTTVTGATGGTAGMIGGTVGGLAGAILSGEFGTPEAANLVEQSAMQAAQSLTYQPRTPQGQAQADVVGKVLQNLVPVAGVLPSMPPSASGARGAPASVVARVGAEGTARSVAGDAGAAAVSKGIDTAIRVADLSAKQITTLPRRALEALRKEPESTPATLGSVGAAGTDIASQRRALAADMPVPMQLTRGQATRSAEQLKFEVESAKLPEQGRALRQRYVEQNEAILRNFDAWIDQTGAEAPSLRATGVAVDKALVSQAARDKIQIRAAYKAAENAGEMEAPVSLPAVVEHLNDALPDAATAPLINVARQRALQLGIAADEGGVLVPQPVPLKTVERFRQAVGRATDTEATNIRQATIIKGLVDEATDGIGGDLYRQARKLRSRYAQNYEDRATVAKLLNTKRGSSDRAVAFEDVLDHAVLKGSLDDVRNLRRVLHRGGSDGAQAWRELQGATAGWIKGEATKGVASDASGNRVISPAGLDKAIRALDHDGRLDFVFGKKGAQQMRDINDLAQIARTVPPEAAINTSNTAATLLAAFADAGFISSTGGTLPVPVVSMARVIRQQVKDKALRRRIEDALNDLQRKQAPGKPRDAITLPRRGDTFH